MEDKILRIIGFILVGLGVSSFGAMLMLPEAVYINEILTSVLVVGGLGSLVAMIIMIFIAPRAESMKCPACGREVDALIGRGNDPETKVCADCYVLEDIKKEQEGK